MLIKILSRGVPTTPALQEYVESKVRLSLGLFANRIERVDVTMVDVNGPKGGEDMVCKIQVKTKGFATIVVREKTNDIYGAINLCAHRVKRSAARTFERIRRHNGKRITDYELMPTY